MKKLQKKYNCPVEFTLACLGGKWKTIILAHLKAGPLRYSQLRKRTHSLSDKVLTERLNELLNTGLIEQNLIIDSSNATYQLSVSGKTLAPVLQTLFDWGQQHADDLAATFHTPP